MRNPYACDPAQSRGRLVDEHESAHRSGFQRDRDRIIHCTAFRRLKHKTQVFVAHEGDHFRTRLTHTIEVAQVARTLAKSLGLDVELAEAVALAHDLGHTPFGHVGEDVLADCMAPFGGFDHNAQALKIVTSLEQRYADFDGLNLTWESLEGIAKHNGPVTGELPYALSDYNARHDLELQTYASAEAQVAALADDIAYNNHDLDDGLRAGLFDVVDIQSLPIVGDCFAAVDHKYPNLDETRRRHEGLRRVFGVMVEDVIATSVKRLTDANPANAQALRQLDKPMIQFSVSLWSDLQQIRAFLFENMYRSKRVNVMRVQSEEVMKTLFDAFMTDDAHLPEDWKSDFASDHDRARQIADYMAGMTDGFAQSRYEAITALTR